MRFLHICVGLILLIIKPTEVRYTYFRNTLNILRNINDEQVVFSTLLKHYLSGFGVVVEAECVAADAGGAGLRQVQHGRHRHARVRRVPARLKDGGTAIKKISCISCGLIKLLLMYN